MSVAFVVPPFHISRFQKKLLSQPFLGHGLIGAVMYQLVLSFFRRFSIDPALETSRWVKGVKHHKILAPTHQALVDGTNFPHSRKFVHFLIPNVFHISFPKLGRLDFSRLVCPFKNDFLSGLFVNHFHRGQLTFPLIFHPQTADRPPELFKNAVL